jgi:NAD(P)H-quinone oxidoreductase subunit 4
MASAGMPGMSGFISEFLVFRGSIANFPAATLLCMVGSGLTAVYFLLLVNRVYFGRLAITPVEDPARHSRLDIRLAPVASRETIPATALSLAVVLLGVLPALLGTLAETTTTAMARAPAIAQALVSRGVG